MWDESQGFRANARLENRAEGILHDERADGSLRRSCSIETGTIPMGEAPVGAIGPVDNLNPLRSVSHECHRAR